jgi:hypothetical protein
MMISHLTKKIFEPGVEQQFESLSLEIFNYQYRENKIYHDYCIAINRRPEKVDSIYSIPFLPISLFRNNRVITGTREVQKEFSSSGTTGSLPGIHYVTDLLLYERSFIESFRLFYGDPSDYAIMALLPSYLEREGSSLVYMAEKLIGMSPEGIGGFYLNDYSRLISDIDALKGGDRKILLLGVTYALLELAEKHSPDLEGVIVMETGGMKGRGREITREELHGLLTERFRTGVIHSEYGMTELLSQAYSNGSGLFRTPPWMRIVIRDMYDPLSSIANNRGGGINIIDLANINSCCFIETSDLGIMHPDGAFEVTGRFDNSDIRGCNLLAI